MIRRQLIAVAVAAAFPLMGAAALAAAIAAQAVITAAAGHHRD